MLVRRERLADVDAVRAIHVAAFGAGSDGEQEPVEAWLLDELRCDADWLPQYSLVVVDLSSAARQVIAHAVCTRGSVGRHEGLGLGPIAVAPERQGGGAGSALVHALLASADAADVPFVALLGSPEYYGRFGFVGSSEVGIEPPEPEWGRHFQVRTLTSFDPSIRGQFVYAEPFRRM